MSSTAPPGNASQLPHPRPDSVFQAALRVSEALLRARTREELLHAICELAASAPLELAWAGLFEPGTGKLRMVARHGPLADILNTEDSEETGDIEHAPGDLPPSEGARERGLRAHAAIPLLCDGHAAGMLHLYAAEPGALEGDRLEPFERLARCASAVLDRFDQLDRAGEPPRRTKTDSPAPGHPTPAPIARTLDESQNFLMNILDSIEDPIFVKDQDLRIILCNRAFAQVLGRPPEEIYGNTDMENGWDPELVYGNPETGIRGWLADDLDVLAGHALVHNPEDAVPNGSEIRYYDTFKMPLRDAGGGIMGVIGITRDSTERVRAKLALARSEASLRQAQALARVGSWRLEQGIVIWDELTYQIFGQPMGQEITYQDFLGYVHADDRALIEASWQAAGAGQPYDVEYRVITSTGEVRWIRTKAELTADSAGQPAFAMGMVQDITDRKHAEEKMRTLNAELERRVAARTAALERANNELESFTYSVSHDLKAPLRAIDGYSTLLLQEHADQLDAEGHRFLDKVRRATEHMSELIEDLLAYARLERRALSASPIDPRAVVQKLLAEHGQELAELGVTVDLTIPYASMAADPEGLTMALRNLLENALKFTRDVSSPRIEIGGRQTATASLLWVRDNGCGFEMEYHDRIFEMFQRLHRVEDYPGTGVGLALVRKAMERMGGRAWAESHPSQGAIFYLEIPGPA